MTKTLLNASKEIKHVPGPAVRSAGSVDDRHFQSRVHETVQPAHLV